MTPGPTPVPPEVLLEMAKPVIHHRTPQYQRILAEVLDGLKKVFKTKNDVLTFSSSGTGAMEASVVNLLSPGEKAAVVRGGKFGERFGEILDAYGIEFVPIDVPWGEPIDTKKIKETLDDNSGVRAVYTTLCETSTGTAADIKAIGNVVREYDAALVVDAVSGLGADDLRVDEWSVDVAISGSQKGLMIPPGLGFVSFSEKAMKMANDARLPKFYFDVKKYKKAVQKNDTPFTPAITLMIGLKKALEIINSEGVENVLSRHERLAVATRSAMKAVGLKLFSSSPSNAVTAVSVPEGVDGAALVKMMRDTIGVTIAGGQDRVKGKIFRVAHLGFMENFDVITAVSAIEICLKKMGYKFALGKGVSAAEEAFL
ncbi:MAG: alanine--glyoxylate aminotransferase family protein [Candidatus Omnitrophota bacterium]